ncbi:histidine N-acetyltransferase [Nematostella vectensis]|uniref:histidine N-acetyltransferase n=1 Tax=Nematostella vectensis TaxID=45351 RepID=UPI002076E70F|nr:histidine N-acetyltransferase [Nematostella vectensis]
MDETIKVRLALESDYKQVVEMSKGIYEGFDYLPKCYHVWLRQPSRHMFVAVDGEQIVGLTSAWLIDNEKTLLSQAGRVNPDYRGQGVYKKLLKEKCKFVKEKYPKVRVMRMTANDNGVLAQLKMGARVLYGLACMIWEIKEEIVKDLLDAFLETTDNILPSPYSKGEVQENIIKNQGAVDALFLKGDALINWEAFKVGEQTNFDLIFLKDDRMFAVQTSLDTFPKSFSHGRLAGRAVYLWTCTVYTADPVHLRAHLKQQLKVAMGVIQGPFYFEVFCDKDLAQKCQNDAPTARRTWSLFILERDLNSTTIIDNL